MSRRILSVVNAENNSLKQPYKQQTYSKYSKAYDWNITTKATTVKFDVMESQLSLYYATTGRPTGGWVLHFIRYNIFKYSSICDFYFQCVIETPTFIIEIFRLKPVTNLSFDLFLCAWTKENDYS